MIETGDSLETIDLVIDPRDRLVAVSRRRAASDSVPRACSTRSDPVHGASSNTRGRSSCLRRRCRGVSDGSLEGTRPVTLADRFGLAGHLAVFTGGTSGLGAANALALARAGAAVIVVGRDEARGAAVVDAIGQPGGNA